MRYATVLPAGPAVHSCNDARLSARRVTATFFLPPGLWEHTVGTSLQGGSSAADEVFVVLSGSGKCYLADGRVLDLQPGTVGRLKAGECTKWEIAEQLRKVWIVVKDASPA